MVKGNMLVDIAFNCLNLTTIFNIINNINNSTLMESVHFHNPSVYNRIDKRFQLMGVVLMGPLTFTEVVSPHTFDYKEAMFYCKSMFGMSGADCNRVLKHLINPRSLGPDKIHFIVAREGENLVGFAVIYYLVSSKLAFLEYIGVLPEVRRKGVGSAIYHHALDVVRRDNPEVRGMFYEVWPERDGLVERIKFFVSQGAISVDISNFSFNRIDNLEFQLLYHPLNNSWFITDTEVPQVMRNLTSIIV
ncbi:MAG: GNAT family N-acetyltransferase [Bacillota bacterium]|nr:GNAT family N-acetyltransferase [Bacillota bacterium]